MLKSVVVSTPGAKFSALAVKADFKESLKLLAELGFEAAELAIRDPKLIDLDQLKALLRQYKLIVPAIGTGQAYGEEGLCFTSPDPQIRQQAVQRIKEQMDLAVALGGGPQILIGLLRGSVNPKLDFATAEGHFINCLRQCLDYRPEIILTLEAINRYETNLYNDVVSVRAVIDRIDRPNLKLLIDTFHMNIEEPEICASIIKVKDYISHVHWADSNRWAPGCGHLDFPAVLATLRQIGYQGAISAEILPLPSPAESLKLTIDYYHKVGL